MLRRIAFALFAATLALPVYAQAPPFLPLQGVLSDVEGEPITGSVRIRFAIHDAPTDGAELWSETQWANVQDGLFTVQLGESVAIDMTMFANTSPLWIGITVDDDSEMQRVPLASVPWAAWADNAGNAETLSGRDADQIEASAVAAAAADAARTYATLSHTQPWESLSGVPADLADGDQDLLATLVCSAGQILRHGPLGWECDVEQTQLLDLLACTPGQILRYGGAGWFCGEDADTDSDTLASLLCAAGQIAVRTGAGWTCGNDANSGGDITAVRTSTGLTGGAESGDVALTIDFNTVQRRVTGSCAAHQVITGIRSDGTALCDDRFVIRYQRDAAAEVRNAYNPVRYHLSATAATAGGDTTPIPHSVITELCGDPDGCRVRLGMTRWSNNNQTAAASREFLFYYDAVTGVHRTSGSDNDGTDRNNAVNHAYQIWDTCFFTDGQYTDYVAQGDSTTGMALLVWNGYGNPGRTCELTIED